MVESRCIWLLQFYKEGMKTMPALRSVVHAADHASSQDLQLPYLPGIDNEKNLYGFLFAIDMKRW